MSDIGLTMVGNDININNNELGFLWDDQHNQFSWANLSTNNSENSSGGFGGFEEEDKSVGQNQNLVSEGGPNGNYKKAGRAAGEGPSSNRKRGRGGACKKKNSNINENNNNNIDKKVGGIGESDHEIHIWTERERRKKMRNMFANLHALLPQLPSKADKSTIVDEAVNYIKALEETFKELKKRKFEKLNGVISTSTSTNTSTTNSPRNFTSSNSSPSLLFPNSYNNNNYETSNTTTREAFLADHNDHHDRQVVVPNDNNSVTFQTWTSSNVVLNMSGLEAHISVCSAKKPGLLSSICYALEKNKLGLVSAQVSSDGVRNMYMIHARANTMETTDQFGEMRSVEEVFKQAVAEIMFWISS